MCSIEGCDKVHKAHGWCHMHYQRWLSHGDPMGGGRQYETPEEALVGRTVVNPNGCHDFIGCTTSYGYGAIKVDGVMTGAHRFAYEHFHGPITAGMQVLHSCDRPCCVNPKHLRLGTHQDNMDDRSERGRTRKSASYYTLQEEMKNNQTKNKTQH